MGSLAIYWDFENIHASLGNLRHGDKNWYRKHRDETQQELNGRRYTGDKGPEPPCRRRHGVNSETPRLQDALEFLHDGRNVFDMLHHVR